MRVLPLLIKIATFIVVLAVVGAVGFFFYAQQKTQIETVRVERTKITEEIHFSGHIKAQQKAELAFEVTGIVKEASVAVGQYVEAGTIIARLDTDSSQAQLAKAFADKSAETLSAKIALENNQATLDRVLESNEQDLAKSKKAITDTKSQLDQARVVWQKTVDEYEEDSVEAETAYADVVTAQTAYNTAQESYKTVKKTADKLESDTRTSIRSAEATYGNAVQASATINGLSSTEALQRLAQVRLSKDSLVAPISGTITAKHIETGELAVAAQTLFVIETTNATKVEADVDEKDIPKIQVGSKATVELDAYPGTIAPATITHIDPGATIDNDDVTFEVTLELEPTSLDLKPGFTTEVTIPIRTADNTLVVPLLSIETDEGSSFVYVKTSAGNFEKRPVTVGIIGSTGTAEITEGVNEGEEIRRRPPA